VLTEKREEKDNLKLGARQPPKFSVRRKVFSKGDLDAVRSVPSGFVEFLLTAITKWASKKDAKSSLEVED
jgi:hypothetical protein